jgi:hypothetical protein
MQVSTDCTTAVQEALRQAPGGLTLAALLACLLAYHRPDLVCQVLEDAVAAGVVDMGLGPGPEPVFRLAPPNREMASTATPSPQLEHAVDDLVALLGRQVDGRGDFDPTMGVSALFDALLRSHEADSIEAALRLAFSEALLALVARASNCHVTVTLTPVVAYTVLAYERAEQQARLFHVRAGNGQVAQCKVTRVAPHLQRLALMPGRVALGAADGQAPLVPQRL